MRATIALPTRRSRRLGDQMADLGQRSRIAEPPTRARQWDAERIARALVPRRDYLVNRLPRELAAARGLTRDQHELVVDEAIDFLVTEYANPIADEATLERAFWAAAALRVRRVHEGRGEIVRAGWRRVDVDEIDLPAPDGDPISNVVRQVERGALVEFAATLTAYRAPGPRLQVRRQALHTRVARHRQAARHVGLGGPQRRTLAPSEARALCGDRLCRQPLRASRRRSRGSRGRPRRRTGGAARADPPRQLQRLPARVRRAPARAARRPTPAPDRGAAPGASRGRRGAATRRSVGRGRGVGVEAVRLRVGYDGHSAGRRRARDRSARDREAGLDLHRRSRRRRRRHVLRDHAAATGPAEAGARAANQQRTRTANERRPGPTESWPVRRGRARGS